MIKAVLFDFDGTLADTYDAWYSLMNGVLKEMNYEEISTEEFESKCWGKKITECFEILVGKDNAQEAYTIALEKSSDSFSKIRVFEESKHVLSQIHESGYKIALVSNTMSPFLKPMVEVSGLGEYFNLVIGADSVENPKPSPDIIEYTLKEMKIGKEEAIFVGDTVYDSQSARSAGIQSIIIGNEQIHADFKVKTLKEVLDVLGC